MTRKVVQFLLSAVVVLALAGCDRRVEGPLHFVGDSLVAGWDVADCFPSHLVYNHGISGSRIDYVESLAGKFEGCEVVVMIGTNDSFLFTDSREREEYIGRYLDAILGLGAERIWLYSLLPRQRPDDRKDINEDIMAFNSAVKERAMDIPSISYIDVYERFLLHGKLNPQLYADNLHLSRIGYEVLSVALKRSL